MGKAQIIKTLGSELIEQARKHITTPSGNNRVSSQLFKEITDNAPLINLSKLTDDIIVFTGESLEKLSKYKRDIPSSLYNKLENAVINKNFKLKDIIREHYSQLNECKTLNDVSRFYPEIIIPEITPKSILTNMISEHISTSRLQELRTFAKNGNTNKIDEFLESIISPQLKNSEKYSDIRPLLAEIKENIISGKFTPSDMPYTPKTIGSGKGLNTIARLYGDNFDETILEMIKRHYINGENISDIVIKSNKGLDISYALLKKQGYEIPTLDKTFRKAIDSIENNASKVLVSNITTRDRIVSNAYKNAWNAGNLKNEWRCIVKHWKILEKVWNKNAGKPAGIYETERLIDAYLLNRYTAGNRNITSRNPFAKYIDSMPMNEKKKTALEMLYSSARPKAMSDKGNVINSASFNDFKAQFDIEGMKKSIEELESHYQKAFLKIFWKYPGRKETFSNALKEEYKKINQNIELTEKMLEEAIEEMFSC